MALHALQNLLNSRCFEFRFLNFEFTIWRAPFIEKTTARTSPCFSIRGRVVRYNLLPIALSPFALPGVLANVVIPRNEESLHQRTKSISAATPHALRMAISAFHKPQTYKVFCKPYRFIQYHLILSFVFNHDFNNGKMHYDFMPT